MGSRAVLQAADDRVRAGKDKVAITFGGGCTGHVGTRVDTLKQIA